jgi:3,4-dehydroadipyl-CoA semialdehyde dehydrogenase
MKTLRSYVQGNWHEAGSGFAPLVDPSTEETIASASSRGIDFAAVLEYARSRGGPALRALRIDERAQLLKDLSKALRESRDELLELSRINTGTTRPDGAFDVDGASGTLAWYAGFARQLGERGFLLEGDGVQLAKTDAFWTQHVLLPRPGAAVHINAFNFPVWGFVEKLACAFLAGMPVITKPATATALVTERAIEILLATGRIPDGALQFICGGTGDLLDRLGPHDVLAFTGSAATARALRDRRNLLESNTRFNIEADSLNAAVLAPDADGGPAFELFVRDVAREITQKTGQKCTAVRRILVPAGLAGRATDALVAALEAVVTGNPVEPDVTMGPLATAAQLEDAVSGIAEFARETRIVHGSGRRADGRGSPSGRGYFLEPTLLAATDPLGCRRVHEREVFGPVATVLPYDGSPDDAAAIVALGGGMLVTSVYGNDTGWLDRFLALAGPWAGRLYVGSDTAAPAAPGSGTTFPAAHHGGPGRAGGGGELGGLVGIRLYTQRVALQGSRATVSALARTAPAAADP